MITASDIANDFSMFQDTTTDYFLRTLGFFGLSEIM